MVPQIRVLVLASLIFFGFSSLSWGQSTDAWAPLFAKAENQDVRVIVQFRGDDSFDKNLSTQKAQTQRTKRIESLRNEFLNSLASQGYQPRNIKKFNYMPFLALQADSAMLTALQANPNVVSIEEDRLLKAVLSESVPLVGGDIALNNGFSGSGWNIAILDTGVDKTHGFFGGRVVSEACFSTNSPLSTSVCPGGVEQSTAVGSGLNCDALDPSLSNAGCDHGTHVAGIAAGDGPTFHGMAPAADLIAIQVFSKFSGFLGCFPFPSPCISAFTSDIILAGERVLTLSSSLNIASMNMSLGGQTFSSNCDGSFPAEKALFDNLRAQGIATVIASGNNGSNNSISTPACISSAISVGSTTKSDVISSFSNTASFLSLLAPGGSINSSVPGNNFDIFSGTSMATPHVAGTWALMKQAAMENGSNGSVSEILTALQTTGVQINHPPSGLTFPRIQVDQAIDSLPGLLSGVLNDFDANMHSDLLVYNTNSGEIGQGFITNAALQSENTLGAVDPATGWTVQATGDFNDDRNADLLFFNTLTDQVAAILLDGTTFLSSNVILDLTTTGFTLRGTGDFDGDGQWDVVAFNPATGQAGAVIMNGDVAVSFLSITTVDVAGNWELIDNGNFNGDAFEDLLISNTVSGETAVVLWDGAVASQGTVTTLVPASNRVVAQTADFTGDDNFDLLVLNTVTGNTSVIALNGLTVLSETPAFPIDFAGNWSFVNAGNYNPDKFADYLLINTVTGDARAVLLDNGAFVSQHDLLTLDLAAGWTLLSGKP